MLETIYILEVEMLQALDKLGDQQYGRNEINFGKITNLKKILLQDKSYVYKINHMIIN